MRLLAFVCRFRAAYVRSGIDALLSKRTEKRSIETFPSPPLSSSENRYSAISALVRECLATYSIVNEPCRSNLRGCDEVTFAERNLGGAERDRTDDLRLAKPALSQLSYSPSGVKLERWARAELNCRPHAYQACALTT
jgi:hypothetical protein